MNTDQLRQLMEVSQFIHHEARLQDEHRYAEWEQLWTDDAIYWVPANGDDTDPEQQMSIIYDNRSRIALRIRLKVHAVREATEEEVGKGSLGTGFFSMKVEPGGEAPPEPRTLH